MDKQEGTVQSQYDLSDKLGAGAYGIVYRAKPKSGADPRVAKAGRGSGTVATLVRRVQQRAVDVRVFWVVLGAV